MDVHEIIDIDEILDKWATSKLGADYIVDKIDTSKVDVVQKSVGYQSSGDWWSTELLSPEEFFDNDGPRPVTWAFSQTVPFNSKVTWAIMKAFKSSKHLPLRLDLSFPVTQEGKAPLQVQFAASNLVEQKRKSDALQSTWRLHKEVQVAPYTSACACARVRVCRLRDVVFATDVHISGAVKVSGYKKGKKWKKHEVSASFVDALSGKETIGFRVIENKSDSDGPARQVVFRFEGLCSGVVGTEAIIDVNEITTLV